MRGVSSDGNRSVKCGQQRVGNFKTETLDELQCAINLWKVSIMSGSVALLNVDEALSKLKPVVKIITTPVQR